MNGVKTILFILFICCIFSNATAQSIKVNDAYTANQLVENVLVNSSCATISNAEAAGDNFSGIQKSYAYFNAGTSTFPFKEGVLLSTWSSQNSVGPFIRNRGGGNPGWLGDSDLEQALNLTRTINATTLEFDFVPLTNFISFNYIFASNEYQDYFPCFYSDGFAFLIQEKGSPTPYQNIAVLPTSTIPVSSTNVHPLIPPFNGSGGSIPGCSAVNENFFGGYNGSTSPINYSGQTTVLNAQSNVIAGKIYHIKLVIADDENADFDSAVFLEAGSFLPKIDLGPDRLLSTNNAICFGESYTIDPKLPSSYTYKWFKNGIELSDTTPTYTVTSPGIYKVEVLLTPSCIATEDIKIEFIPKIDLRDTTLLQCDTDSDGITLFDLTKIDAIVKNNIPNLSMVVYYESLAAAKAQMNPIKHTTTFQNTAPSQSVFARVTNSLGCENFAEVKLLISNTTLSEQNPIITCDGDGIEDGLTEFNLSTQATAQVLTGLPAGLVVQYYLTSTDAITTQNQLSTVFRNTIPNQQTIFAKIVNGPDCYAITPIQLEVNPFDPPNFQDVSLILCEGSSISLAVDSGFTNYLWNTGGRSNSILIDAPGTYTVVVTNEKGCQKTKKYTVTLSGIATITGIKTNDFAGNKNSISIEYTGIGAYEFSIDGDFFQENSTFNGVVPGEYLVYARDRNGCGTSFPFVVYVLDYPRYFTPNDDSYNDLWKIKNLDTLPQSTLYIFDRYGKLLKQLTVSDGGWDGSFNGVLLPADDYWFNLTFTGGKIIKGHFSLKR
ncbi:gliding motility-associated-like protein [Flavobacterium sp. CG_9.1]|uniref:T9SS type B sorting domain-containing protein n=1 Tax=Flavobacterium sp. CG_9.1 TaxID=2787728 RepID=UPI0018C95A07|nr:choice-of-anchor L domain-containing protein [Flavobacterium sp. CG_9.1]MBG6061517.1 gliding motility-associated-like protein [Flavobacterium sp. CG_9.1]